MAVKMKIGEGGVEEIKYLLKREKKGKRGEKRKGGRCYSPFCCLGVFPVRVFFFRC